MGHGTECFTWILSFKLVQLLLHFSDEITEPHRGKQLAPRSHGWYLSQGPPHSGVCGGGVF